MIIPFQEPSSPRYIYINPETNLVHLLVPVVGGQEIGTDNTCKAKYALNEFFSAQGALLELEIYKSALEFDLQWLDEEHPQMLLKAERLRQINNYIDAIPNLMINRKYLNAVSAQMRVPSNLYGIQLRPLVQDSFSRVVNHTFRVVRSNDDYGTPKSKLYNALFAALPKVNTIACSPKERLNQAVVIALMDEAINFETIQHALTEACNCLFNLNVDFTMTPEGQDVNQAVIDTFMGFADNPATTQDYIDSLLGMCALNMLEHISTSPFELNTAFNKEEKLSIATQFFIAHVNIYCVAKGISRINFGVILDASTRLSSELASLVVQALDSDQEVEEELCYFFNTNSHNFLMNRSLNPSDIDAIKQKFQRTYAAVTATLENPHMDDFLILDTESQTGKFVTHQGSICINFAELLDKPKSNWFQVRFFPAEDSYFQTIRNDFEYRDERVFIPANNKHIIVSIELDEEEFISGMNDDEQMMLDIRSEGAITP